MKETLATDIGIAGRCSVAYYRASCNTAVVELEFLFSLLSPRGQLEFCSPDLVALQNELCSGVTKTSGSLIT